LPDFGNTFVRDVKNYVKQYLGDSKAVPPQHVIVYDEAQRAWDLEQVTAKHSPPFPKSEPEAFVDFGERIPGWCVLMRLIGAYSTPSQTVSEFLAGSCRHLGDGTQWAVESVAVWCRWRRSQVLLAAVDSRPAKRPWRID
jgi:Uncharacterized conserved protein (DUF2075).